MRLVARTLAGLVALTLLAELTQSASAQSGRKNSGRRTSLDRLIERTGEGQAGKTLADDHVRLGSKDGVSDWEFPQAADRWINSTPLTAESLEGKGVVLLFFEEECPVCASKWPEVMKLAAEYADDPLLFVAVNSGNDGRTVNAYARKNRISWPVIADLDRSFERELGLSVPVSMENTIQVRYVTSDGVAHLGKWSDPAGTAEAALEGASWRVQPPAPRKLHDAWLAVELGRYADAARNVVRYAEEKRESDEKEFATKLLKAVDEAIAAEYGEAGTAFKEERFWDAYKMLTGMQERFKGYELPDGVKNGVKRLAERDDVKAELKAKKSLDKAIRTASKGGDGAFRRGLGMLKRLVSDAPSTEAAGEAEKILAQYNG